MCVCATRYFVCACVSVGEFLSEIARSVHALMVANGRMCVCSWVCSWCVRARVVRWVGVGRPLVSVGPWASVARRGGHGQAWRAAEGVPPLLPAEPRPRSMLASGHVVLVTGCRLGSPEW